MDVSTCEESSSDPLPLGNIFAYVITNVMPYGGGALCPPSSFSFVGVTQQGKESKSLPHTK